MLAIVIFVLTLFGILCTPFGLNIWVYSSLGAIATFAFELVELRDLGFIFALIWDSALTLIALIVISFCLQSLGFFEWLIFYLIRLCAKSHKESTILINTRKAFILFVLFSAVLSAVLANDGAVLVLTPLVLGLFLRTKNVLSNQIIAFLFATAFVCDIGSNPLIISNLTNIITAHFYNIRFSNFMWVMFLPNIFAILGTLMLFLVFFSKQIRTPLTFRVLSKPKLKNALFAMHLILFIVFIASFFVSTHFDLPLSLNCTIYAGILLIVLWYKSHQKAIATLKGAPFGIIVFIFGLFVVVFGVQKLDFTESQNALFHALISLYKQSEILGIFGVASVSAIGSSIINNLPMVLFGNLAIGEFFSTEFAQNFDAQNLKTSFIYAHLLGCNIGSKLTPIGSLCTLLWFSLLAKRSQKSIDFSFTHYFKYGLIFTLPTLFCASLGLYFGLQLV